MHQTLEPLLLETQKQIESATNLLEIEHIRTHILGKKGQLTELLKQISQLPPAERSSVGQAVNEAKQALMEALHQKTLLLKEQERAEKLKKESVDVSLPGRSSKSMGSLHPVSRMLERIESLFTSIGFQVLEGPEIEDDYHNFSALNIPEYHPARAMLDTFYFDGGLLLRTHTSPAQIRTLENNAPPLRMITPGRVYRCDSDQTHTPMFHQVEGLVVDETCTFAELKGLLQQFFSQLFEQDLAFRFRPSYFPFTEPSAEVDMACVICQQSGCRVCKQTGWLEVGGCGMVHPNVLAMCKVDPERYTGFAFGLGVDRLAMLRYGIDDLRKFFESDVRFLRQF